MGVIISYFVPKNRAETTEMAPLTTDQIAIVQGTWEIPNSNPLDSGEAILFRFFEKYPANIQKFQSFKNTPLLSLKVFILNSFICLSFSQIII